MQALEPNHVILYLDMLPHFLVMIQLSLGSFHPRNILHITLIPLSVGEPLQQLLWLQCCQHIANGHVLEVRHFENVLEKLLYFHLLLLGNLLRRAGSESLSHLDNCIVGKMATERPQPILLHSELMLLQLQEVLLLAHALLGPVVRDAVCRVRYYDE